MANKNVQFISKTFFIALVFLSLSISSLSWASNSAMTLKEGNAPDFITQVGDDVFAQTSDVTIKLEKKLPKADDWPNSIETAQGTMKSSQNVEDYEEREDQLILNPTLHEGIAIYGYPGRKSGLEVKDLRKIKLNDAPGMFKIFMLHTTLDKAVGTLPIDSIETNNLPSADYYALGHLHIDFQYENFVYPGPVFPNSFSELQDLNHGSFYIVDTEDSNPLKKVELKIKEIAYFEIQLNSALDATSNIIREIEKKEIEDKIILLRVRGELEDGKMSDIKFPEIEDYIKRKKGYFMLKNTHDLKTKEVKFDDEIIETENIEEEAIKIYSEKNPSDFNDLIPSLINILSIEKQEGETSDNFSTRLIESSKKTLKF